MATMNTLNDSSTDPAAITAASGSPRHAGGDIISIIHSRRSTNEGSSPWTQIVRDELEPISALPSSPSSSAAIEPVVPASVSSSSSIFSSLSPVEEFVSVSESSENGGGSNSNAGKKPVWSKPSNEAIEAGSVMGAVSWPALSESTRASSKPFCESFKGSSDVSSPDPASLRTGAPATSSTKQGTSNSTANQTVLTRQRSMKHNNSNISSNGGLPQQQVPAGQVVEMAPSNPSTKDHTQRSGFGSLTHSSSDHLQHRNSFRSRNGGPQTRGDGSHHHNHGGRHDQDRGNQEWNVHRNPNGRDSHMQHQRLPRYYRGPTPQHLLAPFAPPSMRPYNPMGFPDVGPVPHVFYVSGPYPESFRMPYVAPMQPPYLPVPDPQLHARIINQIDYYFSNENLIRDTYLRQNMDEHGWVPIKLIAGFKKVMLLTDNIQLILEALRMSTIVELQGDKVRRRNDWARWIMPPDQFPKISSLQVSSSPETAVKAGHDALAAHVDNIMPEENAGRLSVQTNSELQNSGGDMIGQFSVQGGADHSISAGN